jgi:hypothetical protein
MAINGPVTPKGLQQHVSADRRSASGAKWNKAPVMLPDGFRNHCQVIRAISTPSYLRLVLNGRI